MTEHTKPPTLADMLSDSEPPDAVEDITSTTLQAIVSPRENSILALFKYVRRKLHAQDKRLARVERLILVCMGAALALTIGMEAYRTFHH